MHASRCASGLTLALKLGDIGACHGFGLVGGLALKCRCFLATKFSKTGLFPPQVQGSYRHKLFVFQRTGETTLVVCLSTHLSTLSLCTHLSLAMAKAGGDSSRPPASDDVVRETLTAYQRAKQASGSVRDERSRKGGGGFLPSSAWALKPRVWC
jgi:hypothetical protein